MPSSPSPAPSSARAAAPDQRPAPTVTPHAADEGDAARAALDELGADPLGGGPTGIDELRRRLVAWWATRSFPQRVFVVTVAGIGLVALVATGWLRSAPAGAGSANPDRPVPSLPMATRAPATGTGGGSLPANTTSTTVVRTAAWVAVTGAVHRPGLFRVDADARVAQLVQAAGGLTAEADADRINLAAPLHDGERVHIPRRGEAAAPPVVAGAGPPPGTAPAGPGAGGGGTGGGAGGAGSGKATGPVDLNTATAEALDALPGIGPSTAAAIVEHRTRNGPFPSVDALTDVRGIGPAKLEQLRPLVTV